MGIDLKISIIGFTLGPKERRAIECIPNQTGGKYYEAHDAGGLIAALADVQKVTAPPPAVSAPKPVPEEKRHIVVYADLAPGKPYQDVAGPNWSIVQLNEDGSEGKSVLSTRTLSNNVNTDLPIGKYKVKATIDLASAESLVDLADTAATTFHVVLNAATIRATAFAGKDRPIDPAALTRVHWDVTARSNATAGAYGGAYTLTVPAGTSRVKSQTGNAEVSVVVQANPGEVIELPVVLDVGRLSLSAKTKNGQERLQGVRWEVLAMPNGGSVYGDTYVTGADYNLKAGQYKVIAKLGQQSAEQDIEIVPGQTVEHQFLFDASP
jgi:Ca-activated chloride channel family protein